jgi:PAS domain S-box-containing protein
MSVVTTKSRMAVPAPPVPNAPSPAAGLPGHPRDGTRTDGVVAVERRRGGVPGESPMDTLRRLPAVVALERIPVPFLEIALNGVILFANTAFAEMTGYELQGLAGSSFPEKFQTVPAVLCALSGVDAVANLVVELRHYEGWTVRARMSKASRMRRGDRVVLATFDNLTEKLWTCER